MLNFSHIMTDANLNYTIIIFTYLNSNDHKFDDTLCWSDFGESRYSNILLMRL